MINNLKYLSSLFLLIISVYHLSAQTSAPDMKTALLFHIHYGFNVPGADMADRFGNNFSVGGNIEYKFKNNFFGGVGYSYLFGKKIKEDIAFNLINNKGEIVGTDNHLALFTLSERGFSSSLYFGKIFYPSSSSRGGIKVSVGGGILQHKIRIVDDYSVVTQIFGDYLKGYDRLSNGLLTQQYVGYQYLSDNRRINFSVGLLFQQGFTKSSRIFNYDTRLNDTKRRLDMLNGLQVSWILPFYFNDYSEERIY
jgi:hypothetical protein